MNVKLYPMCYCTHRAADAMIELRRTNNLAPDNIRSVDVELGDAQLAVLRNHRPQTGLEAKFSLEFAMAASAAVGRCTRNELTTEFVRRPDMQDFFAKVRAHPTTERAEDDPLFAPFDRVRVTLNDGRELASEPVRYPHGHFRRPVDRETAVGEVFRLRRGRDPSGRGTAIVRGACRTCRGSRSVRDLAASGDVAAAAR